MDKFYFADCNGIGQYNIPLKATNWEDAIEEVKQTIAYAKLSYSKTLKKKFHIVYDYVEVYKNVHRKDLTFETLRNPNWDRKIY